MWAKALMLGKGLLGTANIWFIVGVALFGASLGSCAGFKAGKIVERSEWAAPFNRIADASAKTAATLGDLAGDIREQRESNARAYKADLEKLAADNKATREDVGRILVTQRKLRDDFSNIEVQTATLALGSCNFSVDADGLWHAAYEALDAATRAHTRAGSGKADGADGDPGGAGAGADRGKDARGAGPDRNAELHAARRLGKYVRFLVVGPDRLDQ